VPLFTSGGLGLGLVILVLVLVLRIWSCLHHWLFSRYIYIYNHWWQIGIGLFHPRLYFYVKFLRIKGDAIRILPRWQQPIKLAAAGGGEKSRVVLMQTTSVMNGQTDELTNNIAYVINHVALCIASRGKNTWLSAWYRRSIRVSVVMVTCTLHMSSYHSLPSFTLSCCPITSFSGSLL